MDINEKRKLFGALTTLQRFINSIPLKKKCSNCEHWSGECDLVQAVPPQDVQENGCKKYEEADQIPF